MPEAPTSLATLRTAVAGDAEALTGLINEAFSVERSIIAGDRIAISEVREHLGKGEFLVAEKDGTLEACVLRGTRAASARISGCSRWPRRGSATASGA